MNKRSVTIYLTIIGILLILILSLYAASFARREPAASLAAATNVLATPTKAKPASFDGSRALADVQTQVDFGPRIVGTAGHDQIREWIRAELESAGWLVEVQQTERMGHPIYNIIAKRDAESPQIILGAHYDTRMYADHDPTPGMQAMPVPGANDGASGVAVLLELARTLPEDSVPTWLVFFDTEDNGNIAGWDWILGSRAFVEEIKVQPQAVVIVDMIGDADLNIYLEKNSNKEIRAEIWSTAASLGYGDKFINEEKFSMLDDHTPFLEKGIPAVDIIDFDYPYWHTTQDTPDKVSAESLKAVGDTLLKWIIDSPH
jgi:glutaminyl-peptide cyclotransferase